MQVYRQESREKNQELLKKMFQDLNPKKLNTEVLE